MNLDLLLQEWQGRALAWWSSMGSDGPYYVWLAGGVVLFLAWAWFVHRLMRKLLGYRNFRGTWYNEEQFEILVKFIDEDNHKGHRVMRHDEMQLLRHWKYGTAKTGVSDHVSGYS